MSEEFDPYRKWLGIAPHEQPPHHYRLLGIAPFEDDPDVIQNAADRQMSHIRTFQGGRQREHSQRILNELSAAKIVLLDRQRKAAYDDELHRTLFAPEEHPEPELPPPPGPLIPAPPPAAVMPPMPAPPRPVAVTSAGPPMGSLPVGQPVGAEPLPMGTVPSAESAEPSIPKVSKSRATTSTARVRAKKQSSLTMIVLGLVAAGTLLVAMVVFIATQSGEEPEKKNGGGSNTTVVHHDKKTTDINKKKKPSEKPETEKPEKKPNETVVKQPEESSREQQFKTAITEARDALAKRDLTQAKTALDNANFAKSSPEQTAEVEHLRKLYAYLEDFWKAVRAGINDRMNPGDVFQHGGDEVELVKRSGDEVTLKYNNKEHKHRVDQLPSNIAALFARKALDSKDPKAMLPVAAFWAIDNKASGKSKAHERAKQLWVEAAEKGTKDADLAQELGLDEAFISTVKPKSEDEEPLPKITPKPNKNPPKTTKPEKESAAGLKPAPTDEQQRDARMRFVKRFGEELAKVRSKPAEYEQFLQKLEKEAEEETDDALQFMMYQEASEAAAVLLKHDLILKYIDALASKWEIDALRLKLQYFNKARPINSPATENFADAAAALAKEAEEAGRLDVAVSFGNFSIRVGEKVKGRDQKELLRKVRDWEMLHDAVQKAKAAEEALAKDPGDAMAHLHLGRYLCFFKRDWEAGLKHLVESNSEEEKSIATDDLAAPKAAAAQAAVGERWYTLAKKKSGAARLSALARAKYWLDLALPQLDAAEKSSAESRLRDIGKELGSS